MHKRLARPAIVGGLTLILTGVLGCGELDDSDLA